MENTGGGTHRVSGEELDAGGGGPHGDGVVPRPYGQRLRSHRHGLGEPLEVSCGVFKTRSGHTHVLVDHALTLALEAEGEALFQHLELDPQKGDNRSHGHRVLDQTVAALG